MSDQNNLRDRIKRLVDETDDGESAAQAIIDEFGLYLQKKPTLTRREADDELIRDRQYRVVGTWEKR